MRRSPLSEGYLLSFSESNDDNDQGRPFSCGLSVGGLLEARALTVSHPIKIQVADAGRGVLRPTKGAC